MTKKLNDKIEANRVYIIDDAKKRRIDDDGFKIVATRTRTKRAKIAEIALFITEIAGDDGLTLKEIENKLVALSKRKPRKSLGKRAKKETVEINRAIESLNIESEVLKENDDDIRAKVARRLKATFKRYYFASDVIPVIGKALNVTTSTDDVKARYSLNYREV